MQERVRLRGRLARALVLGIVDRGLMRREFL